ncbi:hypothetical protein LshimejAT787_0700810 [Lyophyllum shimeji]|uniref:Uncharacterized protein n=1 Tax=Lyophyllum shimeji TaxID=47721 RepID=A0A9P3PQK8_LYOSH|nr:hypothetical protein LshimejAT787_0700810 [Lyophyllum shimeji]
MSTSTTSPNAAAGGSNGANSGNSSSGGSSSGGSSNGGSTSSSTTTTPAQSIPSTASSTFSGFSQLSDFPSPPLRVGSYQDSTARRSTMQYSVASSTG